MIANSHKQFLLRSAVIAIVLATVSFSQVNGLPHQNGSTLNGQVLDAAKRPVSAATVYLESLDGKQKWSAVTDGNGSYAFSGIPDGPYNLRVRTTKYLRTRPNKIVVGANLSKRIDVSIEPSSDSEIASSELPQYSDKPEFTVAGVTDTTNLGGHGSDTITRTKEVLATDVANLSSSGTETSHPTSAAEQKALRDAAEREPHNFKINSRLGKLLADEGRPREAIPYLERAVQDARDNNKAELHHLLADTAEKAGDPLEAVREYQAAAEMEATEPNLFDWAAELLLHRAFAPSLEVFTRGNRLFPKSARMLEGLGVALYASGSYDDAISRLCEASDANIHDPAPYLIMGRIVSAESTSSKILNSKLERFVAVQPRNAMARYYYALALSKTEGQSQNLEDRKRIERLLQEAVELDPKLGSAYLQMGILRSQAQDPPGAIRAYHKAIDADPQLTEAHYRLAQAYRLSGETAKSQAELREYEHLSKLTADENERKRHEIQQFVYTLRTSPINSEHH